MKALLRYRLARLQRKLADAVARQNDVADALTHANERTVEPLEEDRIRAECRVENIKAAIARVEERLARPPLLWWITSSGRYDKHYRDGYAFAVEKLKTNKPESVLEPTLGKTPFEGKAYHDGVQAAVAEFEQSQRRGV